MGLGSMSFDWMKRGDLCPELAIESGKIILRILETLDIVSDDGRNVVFMFQGRGVMNDRLGRYCAAAEVDRPLLRGGIKRGLGDLGEALRLHHAYLHPARPPGGAALPRPVLSAGMTQEAATLLVVILATLHVVGVAPPGLVFSFRGSAQLLHRLSEFGAAEECDELGDAIEDDARRLPHLRALEEASFEAWRESHAGPQLSCALAHRTLPAPGGQVYARAA